MYIQILHINMEYYIIIFVKVDKDFNTLKWLPIMIFFLLGVLSVLCLVNMEFSCLATIFASSIHQTLQVLMGLFNYLITPFPHYDFIIKVLQVAFN